MVSAAHGGLEETLPDRSVENCAMVGSWTGSQKSEAEASSSELLARSVT